MPTLEFRNDEPVLALRDLRVHRDGWSVTSDHLRLRAGEVTALVGPSGCGKSTLLLGWTGILPGLDISGTRHVFGTVWPRADTSVWRDLLARPVTVLLQDPKAALDPLETIDVQMDTVAGGTDLERADALRALGLDAERILAAYPHEISGGQAQKVLLAIALVRKPRLLLVDEPTASLDGASIDELVSALALLRARHGTAVLLATHDLSLVAALDAQVYLFREGRFRRSAPEEQPWPARVAKDVGDTVLRVRGLGKSYGDASVLSDVSFEVGMGEVLAIVGPSGCGKSTLARILAGHLRQDRGSIECAPRRQMLFQRDAKVPESRSTDRGMQERQLLFQDAFASLTPGRTIRSLVQETRLPSFDLDAEAATIGLDPALLDRTAQHLSGGERRRAALLRALSVSPPVLILDEPTASLDHDSAESVMNMVISAQRRRRVACILITHDREMAAAYAHRVVELREGRLEACGVSSG